MKIDFEKVAGKVVNHCLRIKPGEFFWILCGDIQYYNFCEEVAIQAIKAGAHPHITISSDRLHNTYLEQSVDYLKTPGRFSTAITEVADVELMVIFPKDPSTGEKASPEKLAAMSSAGKATQEKVYERNKEKITLRKASFLYPTKEQADKFGIPFEDYSEMVWGAIDVDYLKLREQGDKIASVMKTSDKVHITSPDGSDLTFSIKDRPPYVDDGMFDDHALSNKVFMMNLPAGEVCIAPVETSANGVAVFKYNRFQGHDLKNIRMEFRDGRIVDIQGDEGAEYYSNVLSGQTGKKDFIAELGIGMNPRVKRVLGELALDEKIIGTIHIATGENRMLGGVSESSFHWDLVMNEPTLRIGNTTIMEGGEYRI